MPDTTATLDLREEVFYKGSQFFVTALRSEPEGTQTFKTTYQISKDLPVFPGGWKRGPWPNVLIFQEREDLQTLSEFHGTDLARIETEANEYERTLTHIPIITLISDSTELYVIDGTTTYPWDGTSEPPYDATNALDGTFVWDDPGFTIEDEEDEGQAQDGTLHLATVLYDTTSLDHDSTSYYIDSTEFIFNVLVTHFDGTTTTIVDIVDVHTIGRYTITYTVWDNQRIMSYPVTRVIEVHPPPDPVNVNGC